MRTTSSRRRLPFRLRILEDLGPWAASSMRVHPMKRPRAHFDGGRILLTRSLRIQGCLLTLDQGANSRGPKNQGKKLGSGTRPEEEEGTACCGAGIPGWNLPWWGRQGGP